MDGGWALVVSAVVTAVGGILVSLISKLRSENKEDHAVVLGMVKMLYNKAVKVENKLDRVDARLTQHVESDHRGGTHKG